MAKVRLMIVDDSTTIRNILRSKLEGDPEIEVVAVARDPFEARDVLETVEVDVLTLDLEMPRMDGVTFLRHLMRDRPMPVVIVSSLAKDPEIVLACLDAGAVEFVEKPTSAAGIDEMLISLRDRVLGVVGHRGLPDREVRIPEISPIPESCRTDHPLVVVGASTGGTQALEVLFRGLPTQFPPVVAVIHMPAGFTASFARRLDSLVSLTVKEAMSQDRLEPNTIYIAPGNFHVLVKRLGDSYFLHLNQGPRIFNQRPSVDILFESVAGFGNSIHAILLTGMGKDGASGLKKIRDAGGQTIAQDEATSVVFGMPKAAIDIGAACVVLPLNQIAPWLTRRFQ